MTLIEILPFISASVVGALLAVFALRILRPAPRADGRIIELQSECRAIKERLAELREENTLLQGQLRELTGKKAALEAEKQVIEKQAFQLQEKNKAEFENLAHTILTTQSKQFSETSTKQVQELLTPLRERFQEFNKKVEESFGNQAKEQFALKREIENIVTTHKAMTLQTESLTKALRGDVKTQGTWGEIILERILEDAGLHKGRDYVVQGEGFGMKHPEDGSHQKPDIIVMLPENKHVIIDSKVSLTHYERLCTEEDETARMVHMKQYITSIKNHVKGLEERRYQDSDKLGTPDFVLMFMPIEGAFALAVQTDPELLNIAWKSKVAIVCPSTLFVALRTIASFWKIEMQNQNAQDIALRGGRLYDKIAGFVEDMQLLGTRLQSADKTYHDAMNKLTTGRGNIIRQTEELKKLGAKHSKEIDKALIEDTLEEML